MIAATPRARALGRELRAAREVAGHSCRSLAALLNGGAEAGRLDWSSSKVSRCERGLYRPSEPEVAAICALLGVIGNDLRRLLKLARELDQPAWWEFGLELSSQFTALVDAEQRATGITQSAVLVVPGLLQVRGYTRAVLADLGYSPNEIEERVNVRQVRQGILSRSDPVEYTVFLDESALARPMGGREVMAEQLRHVRNEMERPTITVRVVPFEAGAHRSLDGGFLLLEFVRDRPVVSIEQIHSSALLSEPQDVESFMPVVRNLHEIALSEPASRSFIEKYRARYAGGSK